MNSASRLMLAELDLGSVVLVGVSRGLGFQPGIN